MKITSWEKLDEKYKLNDASWFSVEKLYGAWLWSVVGFGNASLGEIIQKDGKRVDSVVKYYRYKRFPTMPLGIRTEVYNLVNNPSEYLILQK